MKFEISKILWLSRHPMSSEQLASLVLRMQSESAHFEYDFTDTVVEHVNMTFPAQSWEAFEAIEAMVPSTEGWCHTIVAGVFPAHIAGAIARRGRTSVARPMYWVPVAAAQAASEDGTIRPFIHSHWEAL